MTQNPILYFLSPENFSKNCYFSQCHSNSIYIYIIGSGLTRPTGLSATFIAQEISNGICTFRPTSRRGKFVFFLQTILLSFTPILLLIVQNSVAFHGMIKWKNEIIHKDKLVTEAVQLSQFIINLQFERAKVCLAVFLDVRSGTATDLSAEYAKTDATLQMIKWRKFGHERIFENKLRFQIRIDDFRYT